MVTEIESIVMTQYKKALDILSKNTEKLTILANELFYKEKIDGESFRAIMEQKAE